MNEQGQHQARGRQRARGQRRPGPGQGPGTSNDSSLEPARGAGFGKLPLSGLLRLISGIFKEPSAPARPGQVTGARRARAAMPRLALAEVTARADKPYPAAPLACACGAAFKTAEDMEIHFVAAFVPDDDIGLDGKPHFELDQEQPRR